MNEYSTVSEDLPEWWTINGPLRIGQYEGPPIVLSGILPTGQAEETITIPPGHRALIPVEGYDDPVPVVNTGAADLVFILRNGVLPNDTLHVSDANKTR